MTTRLCPTCTAELRLGWSQAIAWCWRCRHHYPRGVLRDRDETPCTCGHPVRSHGPRHGLAWACLPGCRCNEKEKPMTHTPYKTQTNGVGSPQEIYRFPNGYGASIIEGGFARGGRELAVLKFKDDKSGSYELTYETPVTDDTEGWLSDADVERLLDQIAALPET